MNPIDQVVDQHTAEPDSRRADSDRIVELERENQRLRELKKVTSFEPTDGKFLRSVAGACVNDTIYQQRIRQRLFALADTVDAFRAALEESANT